MKDYIFFYKQENYPAALSQTDKLLKLKPNDVMYLKQRADVLTHLNKYKDAIETYNKALQIKPDNGDINERKEQLLRIMEQTKPNKK
jgi:tetratricopeptide (TPR) repeat protein